MTAIGAKVQHVLRAPDDGRHTCHWPGCGKLVAPAKWGCQPHWYRLPHALRREIWRTYRPGQEVTKTPSRDYIAAALRIQRWIDENVERVMPLFGGDHAQAS